MVVRQCKMKNEKVELEPDRVNLKQLQSTIAYTNVALIEENVVAVSKSACKSFS